VRVLHREGIECKVDSEDSEVVGSWTELEEVLKTRLNPF